jgi:lactoylglutathione lyase
MDIASVVHVGIRVTNRDQALAFYRKLGFELVYEDEHDPVAVLTNAAGVEINLVMNGVAYEDGRNVLMDVPSKYPGYTHVAFGIASATDTVRRLGELGIAITQGPVRLGAGVSIFVRDPDRNVIELRESLRQS